MNFSCQYVKLSFRDEVPIYAAIWALFDLLWAVPWLRQNSWKRVNFLSKEAFLQMTQSKKNGPKYTQLLWVRKNNVEHWTALKLKVHLQELILSTNKMYYPLGFYSSIFRVFQFMKFCYLLNLLVMVWLKEVPSHFSHLKVYLHLPIWIMIISWY